MKTLKQIILASLVLFITLGNCLAQDDAYYSNKNQQKQEKRNNKKINTGYVFIDGKYVEPPYKVKTKGMAIYINGIVVVDYEQKYDNQNSNPYKNYKEKPIIPKNLTDSSSINDFYTSRDPISGKLLLYAISGYYYNNYNIKDANDSICTFLKSLPNVLNLERKDELQIVLTFKDLENTVIFLGDNRTKDRIEFWKTNNPEKKIKKKYITKTKNCKINIVEDLKNGEVIFYCRNCNKEKILLNTENLNQIFTIFDSQLYSNVKIDSLSKYFWGDRKQVEIFLNNFQMSDALRLRLNKDISKASHKTIKQTQNTKIQNDHTGKSNNEIAFCPKYSSVVGYCPYTWDESAEDYLDESIPDILDYVGSQGYNLSLEDIKTDNNPNDSDIDFENCTYEYLKGLATQSGIIYFHAHGNPNGYIMVQSSSNSTSLEFWCSDDFSNVTIAALTEQPVGWDDNYAYFGAFVNYTFFEEFWKDNLTTSNAIVLISTCYGANNNLLENYGGGFTMAYSDETAWDWNTLLNSGIKYNLKHFFQRMNGAKDNGDSRYAEIAFNNIPNPQDEVCSHSNYSITLCPATKSFYPENNETVPPTVTIGYFEVDTWCDASIPASEALTFETKNGNIDVNENNPSDLYWADVVDGKSNMIVYKWTGYGRLQVNVHTDKIIAYGGGGQELDFDKKTPNGEEGVFYVFNVGYDNPTYVDFTADNYMILENSEVQFTDISTINEPQSYHWDFGDGSSSSTHNPVHTYYESGSYDVTLTISTPEGNLYEYKPNYITVSTECAGELYCTNNYVTDKTVEFYASITGIFEPLVDEYRYTFDFGDGHTETFTDNSPFRIFEYDYTEYGTYETKVFVEVLSQWGEVICLKECSCNTVELYDPFPCSDFHADFSISPNVAYLHGPNSSSTATVNFYNITSGGNNYVWIWNFYPELENGFEPLEGLESEQYVQEYGHSGNTSKTYTQSGIYPVTLTVLDENGCSDSETKNVLIADPLSCINNLRIQSYGTADQSLISNRLIVPWKQDHHECMISLKSDFEFYQNCLYNDCEMCGEAWQVYKWKINGDSIKGGIVSYYPISSGHIYQTDFQFSSSQYLIPYRNTISNVILGRDFNNNNSVSCYDSTNIEIIAINCEGLMHSDDFQFAYFANNHIFLPNFTENGFMIENSDMLEFYSGKMILDDNVNQIVQNNNVELLACNGIILTDGFNTGDKSFIANGKSTGSIIEGCYPMPNNHSLQLTNSVNFEVETEPIIQVIPNPVSLDFCIEVFHPKNDFMLIELFDSQGHLINKIIESETISGKYEFQINGFNFQPGLYFCRYTNSKETITRKFIKQQSNDK